MMRPAPPQTPDAHDWWEATRERRLLLQRCGACGSAQLYPRPMCVACYSPAVTLEEASGRGRVHSFSVVHRAPDPATFEAPYVVALVDLDEGPRVTTNLMGASTDTWRCDQPVVVAWEPVEDGRNLPVFVPAAEAPPGEP